MTNNSSTLNNLFVFDPFGSKPATCRECVHWSKTCKIGYSTMANSKACRQGTKQLTQNSTPQNEETAVFNVAGEMTWSSSGKTIKIYQIQLGKRLFIGQINRQTLKDLTEKRCLTAHIYKYENVSKGEPNAKTHQAY